MDNGFITQMKDKNGDMRYHQVVIDTINENKDKMYQKLLLYSNELEDGIDEINNLNEKISLALESAENRIDKAIDHLEYYKKTNLVDDLEREDVFEEAINILKGVDKE